MGDRKTRTERGRGRAAAKAGREPAGDHLRHTAAVAREYLEALLIAVVFAVFARTFVVQAFKIPSGSMEQNLLIGDHILVNKFIYGAAPTELERRLLPVRPIRRGDVVVFKFPEDPARDFIKRCVGLPGDRVELREKRLFINGDRVEDDSYTYHLDQRTYRPSVFYSNDLRHRDNFGPYTVPDRQYFCLGDNRDNSNDSRFWGPVPAANVKGRAFIIYWSFDGEGESGEWQGVWGKAKQLGRVAGGFFSKTRWSRSFHVVR
jgi:signal peptidase I